MAKSEKMSAPVVVRSHESAETVEERTPAQTRTPAPAQTPAQSLPQYLFRSDASAAATEQWHHSWWRKLFRSYEWLPFYTAHGWTTWLTVSTFDLTVGRRVAVITNVFYIIVLLGFPAHDFNSLDV